MAGKPVTTTFSDRELAKIDTVAKRLTLTRQQLIRAAVTSYLEALDPFKMAGGKIVERD